LIPTPPAGSDCVARDRVARLDRGPDSGSNPAMSGPADNPYEKPADDEARLARELERCPICGGELEDGYLHGLETVRWNSERMSRWDKFLGRGRRVRRGSLTSGEITAWFCERCGMFYVPEQE